MFARETAASGGTAAKPAQLSYRRLSNITAAEQEARCIDVRLRSFLKPETKHTNLLGVLLGYSVTQIV
jgi:hypothetical protein